MQLADLKQKRVAVVVVLVFLAVATAAILWQARAMLFLLVAVVLFAQALMGLSIPLTKYAHLPPRSAVALVLVLLAGALFVFGWLIAPSVSDQIDDLVRGVPVAIDVVEERMRQTEWGRTLLARARTTDLTRLAPTISTAAAGTFTIALDIAIVVLAGVYLAFSPRRYFQGAVALLPPHQQPRARALFRELGSTLRWWLLGRFAGMVTVTVLTSIGLSLIDVPMAVSLGVLAGLFTFIPYLGFIIAGAPILLFAYTNDPHTLWYAAGIYIVVNVIEGSVVDPLIEQRSVDVPPVLGIFSQIVFGLVAGAPGVLVAVPLTGMIIVIVRRLYVDPLHATAAPPPEMNGHEAEETP